METPGALKLERPFEFWESDEQFYRDGVKAPRSYCIMDTSKLAAAGVTIRPLREALADALAKWPAALPAREWLENARSS